MSPCWGMGEKMAFDGTQQCLGNELKGQNEAPSEAHNVIATHRVSGKGDQRKLYETDLMLFMDRKTKSLMVRQILRRSPIVRYVCKI